MSRHPILMSSSLRLTLVALVLLFARDAFAYHAFCAWIQLSYEDQGLGEDYLIHPSNPNALHPTGHYVELRHGGNLIHSEWIGTNTYCMSIGAQGAGTYELRVFPFVKIGTSEIRVYRTSVGDTWYATKTWTNLPASSTSTPEYRYMSVTSTNGIAGLFRVSAAMARLAYPGSGYDYGLKAGVYDVVAESSAGISQYGAGVLHLGYDPNLYGWDNKSKSIIGHEMGHFVQDRLFGWPNSGGYCASQPNALCGCNHVTPIGSCSGSFCCSGVMLNREHCLQSREHFGAALLEGWGHFYATAIFNNPTQSDAKFPYYKEFLATSGGTPVSPPYKHDAVVKHRWMETKCSSGMANRGTEMDWLGFFWEVRSKTSNKYSFPNFATVFKGACGGSNCDSGDTLSWSGLQAAVDATTFSPEKKNHFIGRGNDHGVDN